jgi:hypothetical protein
MSHRFGVVFSILLLTSCAHHPTKMDSPTTRTPASAGALVQDLIDLRKSMGRSKIEMNQIIGDVQRKWRSDQQAGITVSGSFESLSKPVYTLKIDNTHYETHGTILIAAIYVPTAHMKKLVKPSHELQEELHGLPLKRIQRETFNLKDGRHWYGDEFVFEMKDLTEKRFEKILEALSKPEDEVWEIF